MKLLKTAVTMMMDGYECHYVSPVLAEIICYSSLSTHFMSGHHIINLFISCFDWFGGLENLLRFYLTLRSGPVPEDEFACPIIVYSPLWLNWKSCSAGCIISEECFSSMVCKLCSQTRDISHQHLCSLMVECEVKNKYISVSIYKTSFKF